MKRAAKNAFGVGTTLRYTPTLSGVKEDVILDRYRGKNSFSFTLNTGNLTVFEENGRYFLAESAEDEEKIFIGETWVYDSADHFEKGTLSVSKKADGVYTLTIGASTDFLTDPDTVYPVYIDPSLKISYGNNGEGYIEDVTMFEGVPNINCGTFSYNTVGASSDYIRGRTAVRLPGLYESEIYQSLVDMNLQTVKFRVFEASGTTAVNVSLYPLQNSTWTESGATWNNIGNHFETAIATASLDNSKMAEFNITDLVRDWKSTTGAYQPEQGFIMIADNETTHNKQFYSSEYSNTTKRPYVEMKYNSVISISGNSGTWYVEPGGTIQMKATTVPAGLPVTWSIPSTSSNIATIDSQTGLLTGVSCGNVTVTATAINDDETTVSNIATIKVVPLLPGEYFMENMIPYDDSDSSLLPYFAEWYNEQFQTFQAVSEKSRWIFKYHVAGYYTIQSRETGEYLKATAENIVLSNFENSDNIRWLISTVASGANKIVSKGSGLCMASIQLYDGRIVLKNYTPDSNYEDEWAFRKTAFTLVNYYDSTFLDHPDWIENITLASVFAQKLYKKEFGIDIEIKNEPIYRSDLIYESSECAGQTCTVSCGTCCYDEDDNEFSESDHYHHKNIHRIADQILLSQRERNHIYVIWGNNPNTFCSNRGGHTIIDTIGFTSIGNPVIQVMKLIGDTDTAILENMSFTLAHELVHTFGETDSYSMHGEENPQAEWCIMSAAEVTENNRTSIYEYYMYDVPLDNPSELNSTPAFCDTCWADLGSTNNEEGSRRIYSVYFAIKRS